MSFREPTPRALENWDALDAYQKQEVVGSAALAILRDWKAYAGKLGAGVVTVGPGRREKRPSGRRRAEILPEPALKIYVEGKWTKKKDKTASDDDRVPEAVQLRVRVPPPLRKGARGVRAVEYLWNPEAKPARKGRTGDTRYLEVAVPTDVSTMITTARAQAADQALQIVARASNGSGDVSGTACTVVKVRGTQGTQPFLLGCTHVVMRAKITPGAVPDASAENVVLESGADQQLDTPAQGHPSPVGSVLFSPQNLTNLDAALIRLNEAGKRLTLDRAFWPTLPKLWFRKREDLIAFLTLSGNTVHLHPARGGRHDLTFVAGHFMFPVAYGPTGGTPTVLRIVEVFEFSASPQTIGGDSGSPVTSRDWFLGMHIAGAGSRSFMIPAYQLFAPKAYPQGAPAVHRGLELATDLIH